MDDLISRSALLEAYDKAHQGPPGGARKLIESAPDAIVRCKDCKHRLECDHWIENGDDWFCADGERETVDNTVDEKVDG